MYRSFYLAECSALYFSAESISSESVFSGARNVFVCGALQDPVEMSALLGLEPPFAPAAAVGYRRAVERIDGRDIALMVPDPEDPGSVLTGVVWLDLAAEILEKIELLELDGGFRKRISIKTRIGERRVSAYTYVKK
jgi:hypothetical protein